VRRSAWYRVLIATAGAKLAVALVGLAASAPPGTLSPFPVWLNVANFLSFAAAALLLIGGGRNDRRAEALGAFYLTFATIFADRLLSRAGTIGPHSLTIVTDLLVATRVDALGLLCLWLFARDFPPAMSRPARLIPAIGIRLSVAGGLLLLAANLAAGALAVRGQPVPAALAPLLPRSPASVYWITTSLLVAPVFPFIVWKTRTASRPERRRVRLFVVAALGGLFPLSFAGLLEQLMPSFTTWIRQHPWIAGAIVYPPLLSVPFTTAYAILVNRVLDVHLVVRKALQYALVRSATYALLAVPSSPPRRTSTAIARRRLATCYRARVCWSSSGRWRARSPRCVTGRACSTPSIGGSSASSTTPGEHWPT
jgi:hypothetical protein